MTSKCAECDINVSENAFQCDSCELWIHYHCTQLPVYQIILFAKSSRKFTCQLCVHKKFSDYGTQSDKISKEIENQKAAVDSYGLGNDEIVQNVNQETQSESENQKSNPDLNEKSMDEVPIIRKPKICKFYLQKRCKHGEKGDSCRFGHPKLCFSHMKGSCTSSNCEFFHPKLCKQAIENKVCERKICKFYHPNGTVKRTFSARSELRSEVPREHVGNPSRIPQSNNENQGSTHSQEPFLGALKELRSAVSLIQQQMALQNQTLQQMTINPVRHIGQGTQVHSIYQYPRNPVVPVNQIPVSQQMNMAINTQHLQAQSS